MILSENAALELGLISTLRFRPRTSVVLDSNVLHELAHLQVGAIGHLQEHREALIKKLRALPHHLDDVESLARIAGSFSAVAVILDGVDTDIADPEPIQPTLTAPSLHLPVPPAVYVLEGRMALGQLCAILEQIPHEGTAVIAQTMRREIRWATVVIAILSALIVGAIPVFCSLRWERRRWFLYHGSRPPKPTPQAMLSLFGGACSRPSFAI